jgi:hypothetical protein
MIFKSRDIDAFNLFASNPNKPRCVSSDGHLCQQQHHNQLLLCICINSPRSKEQFYVYFILPSHTTSWLENKFSHRLECMAF